MSALSERSQFFRNVKYNQTSSNRMFCTDSQRSCLLFRKVLNLKKTIKNNIEKLNNLSSVGSK